jgi:hypothetical protein
MGIDRWKQEHRNWRLSSGLKLVAPDDRKEPLPSPTAQSEKQRNQKEQGGHHRPLQPGDGPPLDDTDRTTDKIVKPKRSRR